MTSLTEAYEGGNGGNLRRLYAGVALFGVGAILVTAGIVLASTDVGTYFEWNLYEAREWAGILGGVGFPAVLIGTMTVLPKASRRVRAAAVVGAAVCLLGVAMFAHWYPTDWMGGSGNTTMTLVVAGVYFAGAIVSTWCLFTAVANFKARNDPGGTVKLEVTKGGETRVVEVSNENLRGRLGGIGLFGDTPDGEVETQTNEGAGSGGSHSGGRAGGSRRRSRRSSSATGGNPGVTDGGSAGGTLGTPGGSASGGPGPDATASDDAEFLDEGPTAPVGDSYCGNCTHFRYARTDDGLVPYCGLHGEAMDDMDACTEWTPNTGSDA